MESSTAATVGPPAKTMAGQGDCMLELDQDLNATASRTRRRRDPGAHTPAGAGFEVSWATTWAEVREAQRLRYRVFAG